MFTTLLNVKALRRFLSVAVLMAADSAALCGGFLLAARVAGGERDAGVAATFLPVALVAWILLLAAFDLYNRADVRRSPGAFVTAALCWTALGLGGTIVYPESGLTAVEVLVCGAIAMPVAGGLRLGYEVAIEQIYRRGLGRMPTVVVGNAAERERVRRMMDSLPGAYLNVGEVDLGSGGVLPEFRRVLDETGARIVVLSGAERLPDEEALDLLRSARLRSVRMRIVPGALALMSSRPVLSRSMGLPLLKIRYPRLDNYQRTLKRALDVLVSGIVLLVLSPVLLTVAVAVRVNSPGPVFFRQKRAGADEKVFVCYKFRSMRQDAEALQEEVEALNEADGPVFKMRIDPRVTGMGRFLRRWSLDELPQLWNVLKGEMSLVGPRPLPVRDFYRMGEEHKKRLAAIPGMTGYWQISGRSSLSFEEMVRLDLYYIENWSLSFDLKIILLTLTAVLGRKGAY